MRSFLDARGTAVQDRGHYAAHLHQTAFDVHRLSCLMLTPLEREWVPRHTPPGFVLRTGAQAAIADYHRALGEVPREFEDAWARLIDEKGPLRVLIKRYERKQLPGHCVTVIASFYTVPDPYIGGRYHGQKDGLLFEIRKTVQFAGDTPQLVEASVEAHLGVARGKARQPLATFVNDPRADHREIAHFEDYGAGERTAWYWLDRHWGVGEPDTAAWSIRTGSTLPRRRQRTEVAPLSPKQTSALRAFADRT